MIEPARINGRNTVQGFKRPGMEFFVRFPGYGVQNNLQNSVFWLPYILNGNENTLPAKAESFS